jgi:DNA polymerase III epsilon subunit-like protein
MIICSIDFETTGINTSEDRVIEFGSILYSTTQHKCLDSQGMLVKTDKEITPAITKITNVHPAAVKRFGYEPDQMLDIILGMIQESEYVIGYNCRRFDYHVLKNWCDRVGAVLPDRLWIDLYMDLPWQVPVGKLSHTAADHGILNLFPHSALADAQTVLALKQKYDDDLIVSRAKSPVVILQARHKRHENDLVKQAPFKFRWNPTQKIWWKPVKQQDVDEIFNALPFEATIEKGYAVEDLDN